MFKFHMFILIKISQKLMNLKSMKMEILKAVGEMDFFTERLDLL